MTIFGISLSLLLFFALYKSKKAMHMLQQNYYDESHRYLFWITKNPKKVFLSVDLLFLVLSIFLFINVNSSIIVSCFTILYIIIFVAYHNKLKQ